MSERYYPEILKFNTLSERYFCLDFETTSLDPEGEGIIEVYWKLMDGKHIEDSGHKLFWHKNFHKTKKIHQIGLRELLFKKSFDREASDKNNVFMYKMRKYLENCMDPDQDVSLMAHYSPFEVKWLDSKLGMNISENENLKLFDTRSAERFLHPEVESASLIPTCSRRGIESPNGIDFHRAKWDVDAMFHVAEQQFKELESLGYKIGDRWRVID